MGSKFNKTGTAASWVLRETHVIEIEPPLQIVVPRIWM